MAYAASIISGSIKYARVRDPFTANKFIKFMKSIDVVLSFSKIDNLKSSSINKIQWCLICKFKI